MNIDRIVEVNITRQTSAVPLAGFGVPLILGTFTTFAERTRRYSEIDAMIDDGFAVNDPVYIKAAAMFSAKNPPPEIVVGRKVGGGSPESWATALAAVKQADGTWYGLNIDSIVKQDILDVAAWTEANKKLFGALTADAGVYDPASVVDVMYALKNSGYARTFCSYHPNAASNAVDAAWMGDKLPTVPGAATWMFSTLPGIAGYALDDTGSAAVLAKKGNLYQDFGGRLITREGTCADGEYIDIIHGTDWLEADMQNRVFNLLLNSPKVPYTDKGITAIEEQMRASIKKGIDNDFLTDEIPYTVTMPTRAGSSQDDIANRKLKNCKFTAYAASGIHFVQINGTVAL